MKTLIVQPKNEEQLNAIESVLKLLNINFIEKEEELPPYVVTGVKASVKEAQAGELTVFTTVREMLDLE